MDQKKDKKYIDLLKLDPIFTINTKYHKLMRHVHKNGTQALGILYGKKKEIKKEN
jgi:ABC-type enterochelin transport system substrate-binding protein